MFETILFYAGKDCDSYLSGFILYEKEVTTMSINKISIDKLLNSTDIIQDQIDDIILEIIKERKKKNLSQSQLSQITGIPQATISRLESFNSIPTLQNLIKILNALELSLFLKQNGGK